MLNTFKLPKLISSAVYGVILLSLPLAFPQSGRCQPPEQVVTAVVNPWIDIQHGLIKNLNLKEKTIVVEQNGEFVTLGMHSDLLIRSVETGLMAKDLKVGDEVRIGNPTDEQSIEEGFTVTDLEILQLEIGNVARPRDERQVITIPYFIKAGDSLQEIGYMRMYTAISGLETDKEKKFGLAATIVVSKPEACRFTRYANLDLDDLKVGQLISGTGLDVNGASTIFNLNVITESQSPA